ncbi:uncharacterized protein SPSK_00630 [Sporothrix schenckii 1099-18]|uniref:Uncharacterized protein n=1 Tax=Sporothrix schenckii 1099-18 TaxID=1397361 RepID=A0A0F2LQY2_SPOSC|nr:uncharacterized protein SPSK_00630 [Sporothrix schenckii 1099-18]KJR79933.1 hypothetical protein SPSK_00630 [Sporothrix schenckii 1099-18]
MSTSRVIKGAGDVATGVGQKEEGEKEDDEKEEEEEKENQESKDAKATLKALGLVYIYAGMARVAITRGCARGNVLLASTQVLCLGMPMLGKNKTNPARSTI